MKKIISLLCLVLAACSSNNTPPAHDNTTPFYEYMTRLEGEEILIREVLLKHRIIKLICLVITKIMSFQVLMLVTCNRCSNLNT